MLHRKKTFKEDAMAVKVLSRRLAGVCGVMIRKMFRRTFIFTCSIVLTICGAYSSNPLAAIEKLCN